MIGKARQERLWNHLLELERQIGMPLRNEPRVSDVSCPIGSFAPNSDKRKQPYRFVGGSGRIYYGKAARYEIYSVEDGGWWSGLSGRTQQETIKWLKSKIKEHLEK